MVNDYGISDHLPLSRLILNMYDVPRTLPTQRLRHQPLPGKVRKEVGLASGYHPTNVAYMPVTDEDI